MPASFEARMALEAFACGEVCLQIRCPCKACKAQRLNV